MPLLLPCSLPVPEARLLGNHTIIMKAGWTVFFSPGKQSYFLKKVCPIPNSQVQKPLRFTDRGSGGNAVYRQMEQFSTIKRHENLSFASPEMELVKKMLCKVISPQKRQLPPAFIYMWMLKNLVSNRTVSSTTGTTRGCEGRGGRGRGVG